MELDEVRLKSYTVTREGAAAETGSGLSQPAEPATFEVSMDLQESGTKLSDRDGYLAVVGSFVGFTYDEALDVGDRLPDTPFGVLRVESVYPWDDEDPTHYEIGLVPA